MPPRKSPTAGARKPGHFYARQLALDALGEVAKAHDAGVHKVGGWVERFARAKFDETFSAENARNTAIDQAANVATIALTGTLFTGVAVLTGGAALGVGIAIALGAFLVKQGIDRYNGHVRNQKLAQYWRDLPTLDSSLTDEERVKKRAELLEVMNTDAKDCVRKAVVHMRKAIERYKQLRLLPTAAVADCQDAIARGKAIFKYIHDYDKFRNYLLPNLMLISWLLEDYAKLGRDWSRSYQGIEGKLITFMDQHPVCGPNCYIHRERIYAGLVTNNTPGGVSPDELAESLQEIALMFREQILTNKTANRPHALTSQTTPGFVRFSRFRCDLLSRYDAPSTERQIRHFFENRNMEKNKGEKFAVVFSTLMDAGGIVSSPFISNALSRLPENLKSGIEAAIGGGQTGITAGVETMALKVAGGEPLLASDLLPPDQTGTQGYSIMAGADFETDMKDDAIQAEKLIEKVGRHWKAGTDALKVLETNAPGKDLQTCDQALALAMGLYEFHHHFRKVEKYLLSYYLLILRLTNIAFTMTKGEAQAYAALEALYPFIAHNQKHDGCREANINCYGPKNVGGDEIFFKTQPYMILTEPHKPLS